MPSFRTRFKGKAVRFSRIDICHLLVGTCGRFGGRRGRLHVLQLYPTRRRGGIINEVAAFDTVDGVNDCCWSESHQSLAVSALTDGTVKLWDVSLPPALNPVSHFCEHYDEARSVDWNPVSDCFLSASLDSQIKLWTPDRSNSSYTFQRHSDTVYSVAWNAIDPHVFASASGDGTAGLWDVRDNRCFTVIHDEKTRELVSCGWNTYSQFHLATASGSSIHVWDIRTTRSPLVGFCGHDDTVCRIRFSPHQPSMLLSCSVDNTVRTWDWREVASIARYDLHTDRVYGIDMSVHIEGLLASAGWDNLVHIWRDRPVTATLSASP